MHVCMYVGGYLDWPLLIHQKKLFDIGWLMQTFFSYGDKRDRFPYFFLPTHRVAQELHTRNLCHHVPSLALEHQIPSLSLTT
jgi:hypothetical protein